MPPPANVLAAAPVAFTVAVPVTVKFVVEVIETGEPPTVHVPLPNARVLVDVVEDTTAL